MLILFLKFEPNKFLYNVLLFVFSEDIYIYINNQKTNKFKNLPTSISIMGWKKVLVKIILYLKGCL